MGTRAFDPLQLEIKKFIFHVVHHGEPEPILMEETPIDGFEPFFKKRIFEVLDGNRFEFNDSSDFLQFVKQVEENEECFVSVSKELAKRFHSHQDLRIKAGVMIFTKVIYQGKLKYILIKYDHEEVITYAEKGGKALLSEIKNTFSKSKDSLQKSAIVEINGEALHAIVTDKSDLSNITKFFKGFLGVTRKYDEKALTQKVREAFINTVRIYKDSLPGEFTINAANLFYEIVQNTESFEPETFINIAFSQHYSPQVLKTFNKELKNKDIAGETFNFDKNIHRPRQRKLKTKEGVVIQFPESAKDTVHVAESGDLTIVTITTQKLHEENTGN